MELDNSIKTICNPALRACFIAGMQSVSWVINTRRSTARSFE